MQPQTADLLSKYTLIAKKIIYDADRMRKFMKMLGSQEGAITAVQTVMGAIEKFKPIPPQVAPYLGVNIYMLMVDILQEVMNQKPDPKIVQAVIGRILQVTQGQAPQAQPAPQQPQPAAAPPAPQGMLAQGA